jgi:glycosyltransferase involved in cell wall biosynthesis
VTGPDLLGTPRPAQGGEGGRRHRHPRAGAARTRLLQMIPSLPVGGAERMLFDLVTHLDRDRYEITVVSFHQLGSPVERDFAAAGVEVVYLGKRLGFDPRMFLRVGAAIRRARPALVHTHRPVLSYALPFFLGRLRGRVVHTVHNMADREVGGRIRKASHRLAFRLGVAPVAICGAVAESITRPYGRPPRAVIPNGIEVGRFAAPGVPRGTWRRQNSVPEAAVAFTFVGRLSAQKNPGALLDAFAASVGSQDWVLLLSGDGELRGPLEAQARALGLQARVRFLGIRGDVPDLLAASDVFVLPSLYEGHPLSAMEAMAAGRPVVATAVGGVPEVVRHGETGLLVPPGDVAAMAGAMLRLGRDRGLREAMGLGGGRIASGSFDVSRMAQAYDRLYQEVLAGSG